MYSIETFNVLSRAWDRIDKDGRRLREIAWNDPTVENVKNYREVVEELSALRRVMSEIVTHLKEGS